MAGRARVGWRVLVAQCEVRNGLSANIDVCSLPLKRAVHVQCQRPRAGSHCLRNVDGMPRPGGQRRVTVDEVLGTRAVPVVEQQTTIARHREADFSCVAYVRAYLGLRQDHVFGAGQYKVSAELDVELKSVRHVVGPGILLVYVGAATTGHGDCQCVRSRIGHGVLNRELA